MHTRENYIAAQPFLITSFNFCHRMNFAFSSSLFLTSLSLCCCSFSLIPWTGIICAPNSRNFSLQCLFACLTIAIQIPVVIQTAEHRKAKQLYSNEIPQRVHSKEPTHIHMQNKHNKKSSGDKFSLLLIHSSFFLLFSRV